ncbi:MAG: CRISPR-associated RAMP family protein [Bacteroidetes bacterium 4484_249]|nr:MAG: CRISPR-associated RAMP family protein [Bacteroidetes bacterium 4484_249]
MIVKQKNKRTMSVKSVYNFVPAPKEDEVFRPDWAKQVSLDIPFSDGENGEIEFEIEAKTPIFIRNGHSKKDKEIFDKFQKGELKNPSSEEQKAIDRYLSFSHVVKNGKKDFFIPATSIKGMFRNVLEIMSLSRMKQVSNDRYSFRDLSKSDNLYMTKYKEFVINGGWIVQDENGGWTIEECDEIAFIHHKELKKKDIPFLDLFLNMQPAKKTAEYKYNIVNKKLLTDKFTTYTKQLFGNVFRIVAEYDENGKEGILVFTGQSSKRNEYKDNNGNLKQSGKVHEFVFFVSDNPNILEVPQKMQKDFKFIYLDHDRQNISKDWKFWREKLENRQKVPVFYAKDNSGHLKHFGLSYMYKLPYEHSINEVSPINEYQKNDIDFAELIFGKTKEKDSLKGRVFISHAFSDNAIEHRTIKKEILAGPKASYFPYYLEQPNKGNPYKTFMDKNAVLRGFKRYYVNPEEEALTGDYDPKQLSNDRVFTHFRSLDTGVRFKAKIRFHNLRKVEIGALISAITFHGTESKSYHSLGAIKPYGYGKVQVTKLKIDNELIWSKLEYLAEFEKKLGGEDWLNSDILKELFAIAQVPELSEYPEIKEFVRYKKENEYLLKYSGIVDKNVLIPSTGKQLKTISNIDGISFDAKNLDKLIEQIKGLGFEEIPDVLKESLERAIAEIYDNHRASQRLLLKKKFAEEYKWHTIISRWLGKDRAFELYKKLTGKGN